MTMLNSKFRVVVVLLAVGMISMSCAAARTGGGAREYPMTIAADNGSNVTVNVTVTANVNRGDDGVDQAPNTEVDADPGFLPIESRDGKFPRHLVNY